MRKKPMDWGKLDAILQFYPTKQTCADILEMSEDTLEKNIRKTHKLSFKEYRERKMGMTRVALAKKAVKMALDGHATMLIFCLKNLCGWTDQVQRDELPENSGAITLNYNIDKK